MSKFQHKDPAVQLRSDCLNAAIQLRTAASNLEAAAETLSQLPGHPDHAGGAFYAAGTVRVILKVWARTIDTSTWNKEARTLFQRTVEEVS